MELTLALAQKIGSLSIIIALGFLAVRLKIMKAGDSKPLSQFALYFLTPCAMLDAFQYEFTMAKLAGMGVSLLASLIVVVVFAALSAILRRALPLTVVDYTSLEYPNAGNFMLPLIASAMGGEWVIYLSACFLVMNVFMFTHGQAVLSDTGRVTPAMIFKNPVMLSIFAGLAVFVSGWHIPGIAGECVASLGNMMGPVYMFTIGMILGGANLKRVFLNRKAWLICFGRLVLYPVAAMLVLCVCGIFRIHPQAREIITIAALTAGAPSAVMVVQFTQMFRTDEEAQFASAVNILSTVLCLLTMPGIAWLYQTLAF